MMRFMLFFCILMGGLITACATAGPLFIMEWVTHGSSHYGGWACFIWVSSYAIGSLWTHRYVTVKNPSDFW